MAGCDVRAVATQARSQRSGCRPVKAPRLRTTLRTQTPTRLNTSRPETRRLRPPDLNIHGSITFHLVIRQSAASAMACGSCMCHTKRKMLRRFNALPILLAVASAAALSAACLPVLNTLAAALCSGEPMARGLIVCDRVAGRCADCLIPRAWSTEESMSIHVRHRRRLMAPDITARKGGEPIVSLTSYHAHTAAIADKHCDFLLVGDSLGMVMHGYETTVPVPLELMIMHGKAVVRGSKRALIVVDMPFGTYEESPSVAFRNAARVMKETDCGAVKLEGGRRMAETIRFLVDRGIPVMAHIGMTPQSVNVFGGFKTQGRTLDELGGNRGRRAPCDRSRRVCRGAGSDGRAACRAHHQGYRPFRPSALARRPAATARSWSWKICSDCPQACRSSSRNSALSARRSTGQSDPMPAKSGRGPSRTPTIPMA